MARMADFLIIGAARAGTTALHSYLRQHPQIFMPAQKEPNFFAFEDEDLNCKGPGADYINNSTTKLADYQALFADAPSDSVCGEASPLYLFAEKSAARIHRHTPDVSLVAILRNPIEQAYSHFMYATKNRIEDVQDFADALKSEEERMSKGWQPLFAYSQFPRYAEQLERYFAQFRRDQILIHTYEEFVSDPGELLADVFCFIGVDPKFRPDLARKLNAGGVPKNPRFQNFLMKPNMITGAIGRVVPQDLRLKIRDRLSGMNLKSKTAMPDDAREILRERLFPEIRKLGKLLDRDFGAWLS